MQLTPGMVVTLECRGLNDESLGYLKGLNSASTFGVVLDNTESSATKWSVFNAYRPPLPGEKRPYPDEFYRKSVYLKCMGDGASSGFLSGIPTADTANPSDGIVNLVEKAGAPGTRWATVGGLSPTRLWCLAEERPPAGKGVYCLALHMPALGVPPTRWGIRLRIVRSPEESDRLSPMDSLKVAIGAPDAVLGEPPSTEWAVAQVLTPPAATPDQVQLTCDGSTGSSLSPDVWQAFTPDFTGQLSRLQILLQFPEGQDSGTVALFEGEGIGGPKLAQTTVTFHRQRGFGTPIVDSDLQECLFETPPLLVAGNTYTFKVSVRDAGVGWISTAVRSAYPKNPCSFPNSALVFRTWTRAA